MASAQQLDDYRQRLLLVRLDDSKMFTELLKEGMELLDLRPVDLCEQFDVSQSSVRRWRDGHSAPHPAFRKLVISHLSERAAAHGSRVASSPMHAVAGM